MLVCRVQYGLPVAKFQAKFAEPLRRTELIQHFICPGREG